MINQALIECLQSGPKSLNEISEETHIPESLLRCCVTTIFYNEQYVVTKEGNNVRAWVLDKNTNLAVDGSGKYYLV